MNEPTIVVLTRYPEIFTQFYQSVERYEPNAKKIVVTDGEATRTSPEIEMGNWRVIHGREPFCFSRNVNIGVKACDGDVLLVNDDVQFLREDTMRTLGWVANQCDSRIGIVSPQISGIVGNLMQSYGTAVGDEYDYVKFDFSSERLCFVCVYIKRAVFDAIGYMDEDFTGYGRDDDDFCLRAQKAGFKLAVTPNVVVLHGHQGQGCSSTFLRAVGEEEYNRSSKEMLHKLEQKWSLEKK